MVRSKYQVPGLWLRPSMPVCLALSGIFGLLMLMVTPPFQAPDEPAHFYRAYLAATGGRIELIWNQLGGIIPVSVRQTVAVTEDLPFHAERKIRVATWRGLWKIPLAPARAAFVAFPNTAMYSAALYIPQTVGTWLGIQLRMPPVGMMYLGRFCNLLAWIGCMAAVLRIIPIGRRVVFLLAMMPMSLFLAASLSADVSGTAACFLFTALALRGTMPGFVLGPAWQVLFLLTGLFLVLGKQAYYPLLLLVFLVPKGSLRPNRHYGLRLAVFLMSCGTLAIDRILRLQIHYLPNLAAAGASPLALNFRQVAELIVITLISGAVDYARTFVGVLGWLDTPLPWCCIWGYLSMLLAVSLIGYHEESRPASHRLVVMSVAVVLAAVAMIYGIWRLAVAYGERLPLDMHPVIGIQGRYFLPLALPALLSLRLVRIRAGSRVDGILGKLVVVVAAVTLTVAVVTLARRYWTLP
ncbi:DUF2142 domain-containing protein [bacterium]|nr:DUF2142 domain-containing protein [candidate division CSSED10-310 bacterium]